MSHSQDASVIFGPIYCVVSCRCYEDSSLIKGRVEWCEWCRCARCGGRFSPSASSSGFTSNIMSAIPDLNADLVILFGLLASAAWSLMYINSYVFRALHCIGCICSVFVIHRVLLIIGL